MHRYKAVAQIFLFLSIVNFTFAGVAPTRTIDEMHVDLMTEAEERGHTQSEELPEWLGRPSTTVPLRSRLDPIPVPDGTPSTDPADPDEKKFFSKEMMKEVKEYFLLGGVYGVVAGITIGIQREISGEVSPGASTVGRSVDPLIEHPRDQEDAVSHSLSNMKDEHLQKLSMISRRMLKSLD